MTMLAAMTGIDMEMVVRLPASFWGASALGALLGSNLTEGMSSTALQQGGMGLMLTTLILTAPPMAAMFFQGTLGIFMADSQIGGSAVPTSPGPTGQPPGSSGSGGMFTPPAPALNPSTGVLANPSATPRLQGQGEVQSTSGPGMRGNAPSGNT